MAPQPRQFRSSCDLSGPDTPGPIRPFTPLPRQSHGHPRRGERGRTSAGVCADHVAQVRMPVGTARPSTWWFRFHRHRASSSFDRLRVSKRQSA
ncbi:hypothetical protein DDJ61_07805 [Mycobacteroides abscessus]|nr:hypothetical protein DDJ61_07805 [Mycobacteroides abscessus]